MRSHIVNFIILICLFFNGGLKAQSTEKGWTDYRGPEVNGHCLSENIPVTWNDSTNVDWKTAIPGRGLHIPWQFHNSVSQIWDKWNMRF